jgi:hypothetical protein
MICAMRALVFLLATTAMAPLYAQTYKWVDARGVVNYSNVPPPARPVQATPIEDRVSVIAPDPNLAAATAAAQAQSARQAEYAHQEWLARQQSMMQAQALAAMYTPPAEEAPAYAYGYAYPYVRPVVAPHVVHKRHVRRPVAQASVRRL